MLHVIGEKIETTTGKEDSVQALLIVLLRIRTSAFSGLKWCVEFDLYVEIRELKKKSMKREKILEMAISKNEVRKL